MHGWFGEAPGTLPERVARQSMRPRQRVTISVTVLALLLCPQWCKCSLRGLSAAVTAAPATTDCQCCGNECSSAGVDADAGGVPDGERGGQPCPSRGQPRQFAAVAGQADELVLASDFFTMLVGNLDLRPPVVPLEAGRGRSARGPSPTGGRALLSMLGTLRC